MNIEKFYLHGNIKVVICCFAYLPSKILVCELIWEMFLILIPDIIWLFLIL